MAKILVVSTPIFKLPVVGYSGLEHLAWLTAKGLAEKGHEVSLVAPDNSSCPGVTILPVGPEQKVSEKMAYSRYWKHLLSVDAVLDHSWQKHSYTLKQEGRLKAPILGVMHAPIVTMFQSLPPVEKPCMVCISEDQRQCFEAFHNRPARTCLNGVDSEVYKPLNIPRTKRFLFLARFSSVKSPHLAIEACRQAGVGLDLVGDTSITNEPEYLAKCKEMCDGKQIRMVGSCSRSEAVYWYSQAHALLHPVKDFREPFGLAPVESMLCGTPVISWRNGSMKETIWHGETGFLVESVAEVVDLIKSGAIDTIDRNHCRNWAATQFSVERMIKTYEQLIQEALSTGGW